MAKNDQLGLSTYRAAATKKQAEDGAEREVGETKEYAQIVADIAKPCSRA